jgi:tRNA A37 threonylcarbamoyltransferase TsaD
VPDRLRWPHAAHPGHRPERLRADRADARRRRRRGVRQGRTTARPRLPRRSRPVQDFPTGARVTGLDFSFAGLKTALLYKVRDLGEQETERRAADLAASYEHAIVEALIARVERALDGEAEPRLAIGGGVAANRLLRERAAALGVSVHIPPPELCTDNAAMIGSAARFVAAVEFPHYLDLDAYATAHHHAL